MGILHWERKVAQWAEVKCLPTVSKFLHHLVLRQLEITSLLQGGSWISFFSATESFSSKKEAFESDSNVRHGGYEDGWLLPTCGDEAKSLPIASVILRVFEIYVIMVEVVDRIFREPGVVVFCFNQLR